MPNASPFFDYQSKEYLPLQEQFKEMALSLRSGMMPATKKKTKNTKKKNPLYVVTNEGKDVETADNFWDAMVKKFNLAPLMEVLDFLLQP